MDIISKIPVELLIVGAVAIFGSLLYPIIFRRKVLANFERTIKKSTFNWKDKKGVEHSEEVLFKKSKMPLVGDWGRVYPPINEDGSTNWVNLIIGGRKNLIKLLMIIAIVGMVILQFFDNYALLGKAVECCNQCNAINLKDYVMLP